jgi:hypothetical protein
VPHPDRATGDAFEIVRIVTPVLAGLKVLEAPIDLDPWLFTDVALLIARTSMATFHSEDEKFVRDAEVVDVGASQERVASRRPSADTVRYAGRANRVIAARRARAKIDSLVKTRSPTINGQ